jgi:hypothetical protein
MPTLRDKVDDIVYCAILRRVLMRDIQDSGMDWEESNAFGIRWCVLD